ncbi:MAG: hypothetical protein H6716_26575 [Polyangiaceae bacterium]|nr:hypothetical protein [Polyangiaceae bacterium]
MRILAAIEDPDVIHRILTHLRIDATPVEPAPPAPETSSARAMQAPAKLKAQRVRLR